MISRTQRRIGTEAALKTDVKLCVLAAGLALAVIALGGTAATQAPEPGERTSIAEKTTIIVNVTGLRNAKGKVDALLFVSPDGFPEDDSKAFDKDEVSIDPETMSAQIVFKDVPRGSAAVTVLHDENMNRKLDKNFFGIPKEGYGTSNNPRKAARNPRWSEASFPVDRPEVIVPIKLIYW
jgi:uncharacterized protein (DUF2141 family)